MKSQRRASYEHFKVEMASSFVGEDEAEKERKLKAIGGYDGVFSGAGSRRRNQKVDVRSTLNCSIAVILSGDHAIGVVAVRGETQDSAIGLDGHRSLGADVRERAKPVRPGIG